MYRVRRIQLTGVYQCEHLPLEFKVENGVVHGPDTFTRTHRDKITGLVTHKTIDKVAMINMRPLNLSEFKQALLEES